MRLLRDFTRGGVAYYELAHDYMAQEISGWLDKDDLQVRLAREFLSREVDNWRHNRRLLMPLGGFKFVDQYRDRLRKLLPDELELLLRSALDLGREVAYWFGRVQADAPAMVERLLTDATVSDTLVDSLIDGLGKVDDPTCESTAKLILETKAHNATAAVRDILVGGLLRPVLSARRNPTTGDLEGDIISAQDETRPASWIVRMAAKLSDRLPELVARHPLEMLSRLKLASEDPWARLFASLALRDPFAGEVVGDWRAGFAAILRESVAAELAGHA